MKSVLKCILSAFIMACLMLPLADAQDEEVLTLVAAQGSRVKAQPWIDFLMKNQLSVDHYVLSELDRVKEKPYVTVTGGLDEPGIKELLTHLIGAEEVASLATEGAGKIYLKENVWNSNQKVLVFAGSDAAAAADARAESRDTWMEYLMEWFDLEEVPGGLRAY
jgi:hypothetical protein